VVGVQPSLVRIEVRCYGEVAAAVGDRTRTLSLADDATVGDARAALSIATESFSGGLVVLVNGSHAAADAALSDGDTLALSQSPMRE
jgi:molybdopterin converting factor small subunit